MPLARPEPSDCRVIAHVDMDCFYVQVEQRKHPELKGKPTAVVQYNEWKGGGLIAVSYEARALGVSRHMRGDEAKQVCPEIFLVQVPVARGKADLSTYRNAGSEVVSILSQKGICERASIDEVYLDLTESSKAMLATSSPENVDEFPAEALKSHILGLPIEVETDREEKVREWLLRSEADYNDKLLSCGAIIVAQLRTQVLEEAGFTCSAGIAHNKMLAKLASGMNKPGKQTLVPSLSVSCVLDPLPIMKMKQLGGKLGLSLKNDMGIASVGDLLQFDADKLQQHYGANTGTWLWKIARGIDGDEVHDRLLPKSHGSGKSFPGPRALKKVSSVQHWLNQLGEELSERVQSDFNENKRIAHTLTLHATAYKNSKSDCERKFPSKSCPLRYGTNKIQEDSSVLFQAALREFLRGENSSRWAVTSLSISASKITDIPSVSSLIKYVSIKAMFENQGTSSIMRYFPSSSMKQDSDNAVSDSVNGDLEVCSTSNNVQMESKIHQENAQSEGKPMGCAETPRRTLNDHKPVAHKNKRKGEALQERGTIQRFFCGKLCSSKSSVVESGGESQKDEQPYNANEIDFDVIGELPPLFQQEINTWLRFHERQTSGKRGSTIADFFSPSKFQN